MARSGPRVVLLDPEHWDAFELLASALRSHDVDVVHLVPRPADLRAPARLRERLIFGTSGADLPALGSGGSIDDWLAAPTVDVQGPDDLVAAWRPRSRWPDSPLARRIPDDSRVPLLFDKVAMQHLAAGLGIVVPRIWQEPPPGVLPIVVKRATGSGGAQVRIARTEADLAAAIQEVDPDGLGGVFYQEHLTGPAETFGGVADHGRLVVGATYRLVTSPLDPLGPAERIEIVDSSEIHEQIALLCRELVYTGFLCVDFMRLPDGRAAMIDVNPRVFGSWLAVQQAGFDVLGAYLALLGVSERQRSPRSAELVPMVRHTPRAEVSGWREWAAEARSSARSLAAAARVVGWRYTLVGGLRSTARLGALGVGLVRQR